MDSSAALRAVDSSSLLQHFVGIKMLSNIKQQETAKMTTMLADFVAAQPINPKTPIPAALMIGRNLDITI